jgi:hypothetical protein
MLENIDAVWNKYTHSGNFRVTLKWNSLQKKTPFQIVHN